MKYRKVICVDDCQFDLLTVNNYYMAKKCIYLNIPEKDKLYSIYDLNKNYIGHFSQYMFRDIKDVRNNKINIILRA